MFGRRHHTTSVAPARHRQHRHHKHRTTKTTTTTTPRRGLFGRKKVVVHQKRRTSFSDKVSGAFLKLKGSLTGRPGQKAAGTRRMHGTDGRGSRRSRRW